MFRRFLTYCLLLLSVCTAMADGVDHLGSIREVMKADGFLNPCIIAVPYQGTLNPCDYDAWGRQTVALPEWLTGTYTLVFADDDGGCYYGEIEL